MKHINLPQSSKWKQIRILWKNLLQKLDVGQLLDFQNQRASEEADMEEKLDQITRNGLWIDLDTIYVLHNYLLINKINLFI